MKRLLFLLAVLLLLPVLSGCWSTTPVSGERLPAERNVPQNGTSTTPVPPQPGTSTTPSQPENSPGAAAATGNTLLTREEAEKAALAYAGVTTDQVTRLHTEADLYDTIPHYDVEFHRDGFEYDCEINALTGEVLSYERERG